MRGAITVASSAAASQYDSATPDNGPKGLPLTLILKGLTMTGFVQMTYRSKRHEAEADRWR